MSIELVDLHVVIPAASDLDQVALAAKRAWIGRFVEIGDSQAGLARKLGITYREMRYLLQCLGVTVASLSMDRYQSRPESLPESLPEPELKRPVAK